MTIDQALAWLRGLDKKEYWGGREYTDLRNVLPQLIGVVEAVSRDPLSWNQDYCSTAEARQHSDAWGRLNSALAALAAAVEKESK